MLCALKNYVKKAKKVIFAKMSLTGVLSGSDEMYSYQTVKFFVFTLEVPIHSKVSILCMFLSAFTFIINI